MTGRFLSHYALCFYFGNIRELSSLFSPGFMLSSCIWQWPGATNRGIRPSICWKGFIISSFCRPMILLFIVWDYPPDFIHVLNLFGMTQCIAALSATFNDSIAIPCTIAIVAFMCRNLGQVALHMHFWSTIYVLNGV